MTTGIARLGHILMVISILAATGGHWNLLQVVAWGGMLVEYSQDGGITKAIEKTFDGQHPCGLCGTIQKGKQAEKKHLPLTRVQKVTLFCVLGASFVAARRRSWSLNFSDLWSEPRPASPLFEPPRLGLS